MGSLLADRTVSEKAAFLLNLFLCIVYIIVACAAALLYLRRSDAIIRQMYGRKRQESFLKKSQRRARRRNRKGGDGLLEDGSVGRARRRRRALPSAPNTVVGETLNMNDDGNDDYYAGDTATGHGHTDDNAGDDGSPPPDVTVTAPQLPQRPPKGMSTSLRYAANAPNPQHADAFRNSYRQAPPTSFRGGQVTGVSGAPVAFLHQQQQGGPNATTAPTGSLPIGVVVVGNNSARGIPSLAASYVECNTLRNSQVTHGRSPAPAAAMHHPTNASISLTSLPYVNTSLPPTNSTFSRRSMDTMAACESPNVSGRNHQQPLLSSTVAGNQSHADCNVAPSPTPYGVGYMPPSPALEAGGPISSRSLYAPPPTILHIQQINSGAATPSHNGTNSQASTALTFASSYSRHTNNSSMRRGGGGRRQHESEQCYDENGKVIDPLAIGIKPRESLGPGGISSPTDNRSKNRFSALRKRSKSHEDGKDENGRRNSSFKHRHSSGITDEDGGGEPLSLSQWCVDGDFSMGYPEGVKTSFMVSPFQLATDHIGRFAIFLVVFLTSRAVTNFVVVTAQNHTIYDDDDDDEGLVSQLDVLMLFPTYMYFMMPIVLLHIFASMLKQASPECVWPKRFVYLLVVYAHCIFWGLFILYCTGVIDVWGMQSRSVTLSASYVVCYIIAFFYFPRKFQKHGAEAVRSVVKRVRQSCVVFAVCSAVRFSILLDPTQNALNNTIGFAWFLAMYMPLDIVPSCLIMLFLHRRSVGFATKSGATAGGRDNAAGGEDDEYAGAPKRIEDSSDVYNSINASSATRGSEQSRGGSFGGTKVASGLHTPHRPAMGGVSNSSISHNPYAAYRNSNTIGGSNLAAAGQSGRSVSPTRYGAAGSGLHPNYHAIAPPHQQPANSYKQHHGLASPDALQHQHSANTPNPNNNNNSNGSQTDGCQTPLVISEKPLADSMVGNDGINALLYGNDCRDYDVMGGNLSEASDSSRGTSQRSASISSRQYDDDGSDYYSGDDGTSGRVTPEA